MSIANFGYLLVLIIMIFVYVFIRKALKLPPIGNPKQLVILFGLTYLTTFLWDNFAVFSKHWEYKNMIGIYVGYSPIENILFAMVYPLAVITVYQLVSKFIEK